MPDLSPAEGSGVTALIDGALSRLDGLEELPVHEHVEVFDGLHRALQDALATLDEA